MSETDLMTDILGYPPNTEMRMKLMNEARDQGLPLGEVTARYSLPEMLIQGPDGLYPTSLGRMSIEEYKAKCNPWKRLVIIKSE